MRQFRVSKIHPHCLKPSTLLVVAAIAGATLLTSCTREPLTTASDTTTSQIPTPAEQDNGQTWEAIGNEGVEGMVLYMAVAPSNSKVIYAATEHNQIVRSQDGGLTWEIL